MNNTTKLAHHIFYIRYLSPTKWTPKTIVALLHDVVEDTPITLDDLRDKGYSDEIIVAIDALTRRTDETYSAYIERLSNNKLARRVKIADLQHNLDPERTKMLDNASLQNRYRNALQKLTDIELEENNHA